MSKQLHFISCVEDSPRFVWESIVQLFNMRKYGYSKDFRIIVYHSKELSKEWENIEKMFPETKFFYYSDDKGLVQKLMTNYFYTPIHRLCSLQRHFQEYPELSKDAIFYLDSDVIFLQQPDIERYVQDEINYLSDTKTYLNLAYLDSKIKDVKEDKKEEYERVDIVGKAALLAGLNREILEKNNDSTGGAQYILKNVTPQFFSDCIDICLNIRMHFLVANQYFFPGNPGKEREDRGIQSWTADMWAIQWNLWRKELPSVTPKFMDFAWSTDKIENIQRDKPHVFMLHNAGIVSDAKIRETHNQKTVKDEDNKPVMVEAPAFFKDNFKKTSVFSDIASLETIANHPITSKYYNAVYVNEILDTYNNLLKQ